MDTLKIMQVICDSTGKAVAIGYVGSRWINVILGVIIIFSISGCIVSYIRGIGR